MAQPLSPREVFGELIHGVCEKRWDDVTRLYAEHTDVIHPLDPFRAPALLTRDELHEHFTGAGETLGDIRFEPVVIAIHETTDPEVVIGEFEYRGSFPATGEPFARPGIFVLRVRDGQIVSSRDYVDHLGMARLLGRLDELVTALA
jgi:ketosteroid isomerase-like protein